MGVERVVHFTSNTTPGWTEIAAILATSGDAPILRMIDGLPAFPDEPPDPSWRELRISLSGGMVTLRRESNAIRCVVWSLDDPALQAALDRCASAVARAGDGTEGS